MTARILHLSADYPDSFQPNKTRAIAGLVEGTADQFEHLVISLNRAGGLAALLQPGALLESRLAGQVLAVRYAAPPAIVAIARAMDRLADRLASRLQRIGFQPDLIQAHKLTVEGPLAQRLSARMGVPYVLTLQGNTDQKLLTARPDRKGALRQVWHDAQGVMAFAPWTASWCSEQLGARPAPSTIIPCVLPHDDLLAPEATGPVIRTAFHLDHWRNKNIATLLEAIVQLAPDFPDVQLEIAGDGTPASVNAITARIAAQGLRDRVRLVGRVTPEAIQHWFHKAAVFALPTHRESFGMVFAEALLAGTPVLHPSGCAIDGFFNDRPFARRVDADDTRRLAAALAEMLTRQAVIKAELAAAQAAGELDCFRRDHVLSAYRRFLEQAIGEAGR